MCQILSMFRARFALVDWRNDSHGRAHSYLRAKLVEVEKVKSRRCLRRCVEQKLEQNDGAWTVTRLKEEEGIVRKLRGREEGPQIGEDPDNQRFVEEAVVVVLFHAVPFAFAARSPANSGELDQSIHESLAAENVHGHQEVYGEVELARERDDLHVVQGKLTFQSHHPAETLLVTDDDDEFHAQRRTHVLLYVVQDTLVVLVERSSVRGPNVALKD
mmetsp:Transcript_2311/g.6906  ORF Transcript_2311/g.6906 Transcript_2311/m.6906 type:complete len:216 (-) Transcript_2311:1088-1735(-)